MTTARGRPFGRRRAPAAAVVAVAVLAGLAAPAGVRAAEPACVPVPGGGTLTLLGVGQVVFEELATDRARDAATFGGRVCVVASDGTVVVRSERLEVRGLSADVRLAASSVAVEVPGWSLTAARLEGGAGWVVLQEVAIVGVDAVGLADRLRLDLATGALEAEALRLATASTRLDARRARLDGTVLWADDARLSSCDCPPDEAPVRVEAAGARFDLASESLTMDGGALALWGRRWPLPDPVTLAPTALGDLRLPFELGPDPAVEGAWRLRLLPRVPDAGAEVAWSVAGGGGVPVRLASDGTARAGDASVRWTLASDAVDVELEGDGALGGGWRWRAGQRFEAGAVEDPVRDTWARVARTYDGADGRASATVGATAALTGQTLAGREVAGPRFGLDARATWSATDRPVALSWTVAAGVTGYPGLDLAQGWVSVRPRASLALGAVRAVLAHESRWVAGGSPFGTGVDRVTPLHRTEATLAYAGDASARAELVARYRWDPDPVRPGRRVGLEALTATLGGTVAWGDGWLAGELEVALAGRLDPRADRDAYARATLAWSDGRWEVGTRTTLGLRPGDGWREVTVFAAAPFTAGPDWTLRPYLAVDAFAFAGGSGPWLRGHGLDLAWSGCCGTLEVGYRSEVGGATTTRLAVALPVRALDPERLAPSR